MKRMAFETPITIRQAISRINEREYVFPAIQRECVWTPDQIILSFANFVEFTDERRELMRARLREELGLK